MNSRPKETIEDIAAELRLGFTGNNVTMYFMELANRIEAAHNEGVLKAVSDPTLKGWACEGNRASPC